MLFSNVKPSFSYLLEAVQWRLIKLSSSPGTQKSLCVCVGDLISQCNRAIAPFMNVAKSWEKNYKVNQTADLYIKCSVGSQTGII